jgi:membrane protein DedA with SNARE-associated domain
MRKISIIFLFISISCLFIHAESLQTQSKTDSTSLLNKIEVWYENNTNYFSITALMAAESSILPVPSEMVIPPAVYVAMKPGSDLSIFLIILFGTIGALIGASFNYLMSMWLGRFVVYKFADSKVGKLFMLSSLKIQKAETFFNDHGKTSTFIGRLIPVVRHLISIPAGLAKMNYLTFILYTFLGAGLWNIILAGLGYVAGENRELINSYSHELSIVFVGIGALLLGWLVFKSVNKRKPQTPKGA